MKSDTGTRKKDKRVVFERNAPAALKRLLELVAFNKLPNAAPESNPDFSRLALDRDLMNDSILDDKFTDELDVRLSFFVAEALPSPEEGTELLLLLFTSSESNAGD